MFHADHPPPHLHATYGEHESVTGLDPVVITAGSLPIQVARLVLERPALHGQEFLAKWERGRQRQTLRRIDPLP